MIAVIDWETTGLTLHPDAVLSKQPRAVEFGGIVLSSETGEVVRELSQLIHPGMDVSAEITKITGITNEALVGQPSFEQFLPTLREFFAGCTGLMAHNLPFDKSILTFELKRLGVEDFPWPERELCTVGVYKDLWGKRPRLQDLYPEVTGKPFEQKHRALDDTAHLVEIIQKDEIWRLI